MLNIPHTPDEAEGFEYISDFLYPEGVLDEQALDLFLTPFLGEQEDNRHRYGSSAVTEQKQLPAMGLLLRLLDPATTLKWGATFEQWYCLYRMSNPGHVAAWFCLLDDAHKDAAKTSMLRLLDAAPPVEIRVALMMDGAEHYSHLPLVTFIGKSLLRVKSAAFVKALKPTQPQMPMVLRLSNALKESDPKFAELAEAIAMGVFVQRMATEPAPGNPQRGYSACEAIALLLDHNVEVNPALLVASAQKRFKGSSLLNDMMQFVNWALNKDLSPNWMMRVPGEKDKNVALAMMPALLVDIAKQDTKNNNFDNILVAAHKVYPSSDELNRSLYDWFMRRSQSEKAMSTAVFAYVLDNFALVQDAPGLWQRWYASEKVASAREMVAKHVQQGVYHRNQQSARYFELLMAQSTPGEVVNVLFDAAMKAFNPENARKNTHHYPSDTEAQKKERQAESYRSGMVTFFQTARHWVNNEVCQKENFKQLVAATSMTYLQNTSLAHGVEYETKNGVFANLLAEPLPLLRSAYPEHTTALNALRKDVIGSLAKNTAHNYHQALYNVLGRALYGDTMLSAGAAQGLAESMGLDLFAYYQSCHLQTEVHFEVSGDVFESGMF